MQTGLGIFNQQQRSRVAIEAHRPFRLQEGGKQPQQDHPMAAPAGLVDHPVDNIQITPTALFIMGAPPHQAMPRLSAALLGKVMLKQLHHGR
ncbi:Uncharacterised protein [Klebsiella pneumoniae]|nr:Uncharacterised protein [Klebsiella pneumoniae]